MILLKNLELGNLLQGQKVVNLKFQYLKIFNYFQNFFALYFIKFFIFPKFFNFLFPFSNYYKKISRLFIVRKILSLLIIF